MPFPFLESFPALAAIPGLRHGFILRHPGIDVRADRETALSRLGAHHQAVLHKHLGVDLEAVWLGEQIHADRVELCQGPAGGRILPGTDGLAADGPGAWLGIHVADCCAVYLVDPVRLACGLVHSGKKGTALGIAGRAIRLMIDRCGTDPGDLIVQLSPCIRPPAYEVDIAAAIRSDCADAGVPSSRIHDSGACTSRDLSRYYSYRAEKGRTGRHLAVLGWEA